jgi:hypothetical protein
MTGFDTETLLSKGSLCVITEKYCCKNIILSFFLLNLRHTNQVQNKETTSLAMRVRIISIIFTIKAQPSMQYCFKAFDSVFLLFKRETLHFLKK